jgi:hypothetical protein
VKLNISSHAHPFRSRGAQLACLGALAFAAQVACSDAPGPKTTPFPMTSAGSAGTPASTAGASGSFTSAGTGGTFGTAGSFTSGGMGGQQATGGSAGAAGAATAGTGGVIVTAPYCEGKTLTALPFNVQSAFFPSAWQGDFSQIAIPEEPTVDACADRAEGALGDENRCSAWRYTPNATAASWAAVAWSTYAEPNFTHPPVCLAAGATAVTFFARGVAGGEKLSVAALGAQEMVIELTDEWERYEIPLAGVEYNSFDVGVKTGFSWKVDPATPPAVTPVTEFFIDSIQVVSGDPGGGEGGASGMGGAGGETG